MRDTIILTIYMVLFGYASRADGTAEFIMGPDPCWDSEFAIVEEDEAAQRSNVNLLCGKMPKTVALGQNYVPGHSTMFWNQTPEMLAAMTVPPTPVPLEGSLGFLVVALIALWGVKRRIK